MLGHACGQRLEQWQQEGREGIEHGGHSMQSLRQLDEQHRIAHTQGKQRRARLHILPCAMLTNVSNAKPMMLIYVPEGAI